MKNQKQSKCGFRTAQLKDTEMAEIITTYRLEMKPKKITETFITSSDVKAVKCVKIIDINMKNKSNSMKIGFCSSEEFNDEMFDCN